MRENTGKDGDKEPQFLQSELNYLAICSSGSLGVSYLLYFKQENFCFCDSSRFNTLFRAEIQGSRALSNWVQVGRVWERAV